MSYIGTMPALIFSLASIFRLYHSLYLLSISFIEQLPHFSSSIDVLQLPVLRTGYGQICRSRARIEPAA